MTVIIAIRKFRTLMAVLGTVLGVAACATADPQAELSASRGQHHVPVLASFRLNDADGRTCVRLEME